MPVGGAQREAVSTWREHCISVDIIGISHRVVALFKLMCSMSEQKNEQRKEKLARYMEIYGAINLD